MPSIADQSITVRRAVWVAIAIGAVASVTVVEKQLRTQVALRLKTLAERWEIFE